MPKRNNTSKKAAASVAHSIPEEERFASILIVPKSKAKTPPQTAKNKTPKQRPEFQEPEPVSPPAMKTPPLFSPEEMAAYRKRMNETYYRAPTETEIAERLSHDWNDSDWWETRLEILEAARWKIVRRGTLNAEQCHELDELDAKILECDYHLERLFRFEEEDYDY